MIDKELHIKIVGIYGIFAIICGLGVWTTLPAGLSLLVTLLVLMMCGGVHGFIVLKEFYKTGSEIIVEARDTQSFVQTEVNNIQQRIDSFSTAINDLNNNQFLLEDRLTEAVRKIENFPTTGLSSSHTTPHQISQDMADSSLSSEGHNDVSSYNPEDISPEALENMDFLSPDRSEEFSNEDEDFINSELSDFTNSFSHEQQQEMPVEAPAPQQPQAQTHNSMNFEDSLLDDEFEDVTEIIGKMQNQPSEFSHHSALNPPPIQEANMPYHQGARLKNIPIEGMGDNALFDEDFEEVSPAKFTEHDKQVINEWGRLSHSLEAPLESLSDMEFAMPQEKQAKPQEPLTSEVPLQQDDSEDDDFDFLSEDFSTDDFSLDEELQTFEQPQTIAEPITQEEERILEAVGAETGHANATTSPQSRMVQSSLASQPQRSDAPITPKASLPSLHELVPELSLKTYARKAAHIQNNGVPSLANIIAQNDEKEHSLHKQQEQEDILQAFEALKQEVNNNNQENTTNNVTHLDSKRPAPQKETQANKPIIIATEPLENLLPTVRHALENNQINSCVLPIVGSQDKKTYYYQILPYLYHKDEQYYPIMPIMSQLKQTGLETAIDKQIMTRCITVARNLYKASPDIGLFMQVHVKSLTDGEFFDEFYEMILEKQQVISKIIIAFSQNQLAYMTSVRLEKMMNLVALGVSFAITDIKAPLSDLQELKTIGFNYLKISLEQIATGISIGGNVLQGTQIKQLCDMLDIKLIVDELQNSYDIISAAQSGADFITSTFLSELERVG